MKVKIENKVKTNIGRVQHGAHSEILWNKKKIKSLKREENIYMYSIDGTKMNKRQMRVQ